MGIIEWWKWGKRRGRFTGLDLDTRDRPQVRPVPEPPADRQTHAPGHDLAIALWDRARGDDDS